MNNAWLICIFVATFSIVISLGTTDPVFGIAFAFNGMIWAGYAIWLSIEELREKKNASHTK